MDGWQTKVVPFTGGLITNQSPYQQGFNNPGSARILINYEPSVKGGYRRINGYTKVVSTPVPFYGDLFVQGSGQSGNNIMVGNVFVDFVVGDVLEFDGVSGSYTVTATSYEEDEAQSLVTVTPALASSPADKAAVVATDSTYKIYGLANFDSDVVVSRGGSIFRNAGAISKVSASTAGWEMVSKPYYGSNVTVSSTGATGNTINITGCEYRPAEEATIQFAGVEKTYRIDAVSEVGSGEYTLTIYPALASSPANGATVTSTGYNCAKTDVAGVLPTFEFVEFHTGLMSKLVGVTGTRYPFVLDEDGQFILLSSIPSDAYYATTVAYNKSTLFLAAKDLVTFSAPANEHDFSAANGGGVISVGTEVTKLISFREQLIVFGAGSISRITGTSIADFQLLPITRDLGCSRGKSVREVGGDIMFLGPDGLRLLGATDRIGDFNLDTVASNIQNAVNNLVSTYPDAEITSVTIRGKSQYRIFAHGSSLINGKGLLGANLVNPQGGTYWAWSELKNFEVMHADSEVYDNEERVVFTNRTGYVFWMDEGNSFDGANIPAVYATPFIPFDDPEVRKTMYKMFMYIDPEGSVDVKSSMKFDFNDPDAVLPGAKQITLSNSSTAPASYGTLTAAYGVARYGGSLRAVFKTQLVGSAFSVSFYFASEDTNPPYTLDTMTIEYAMRGRR
jgi:hypothetical protein